MAAAKKTTELVIMSDRWAVLVWLSVVLIREVALAPCDWCEDLGSTALVGAVDFGLGWPTSSTKVSRGRNSCVPLFTCLLQ